MIIDARIDPFYDVYDRLTGNKIEEPMLRANDSEGWIEIIEPTKDMTGEDTIRREYRCIEIRRMVGYEEFSMNDESDKNPRGDL